MDTGRKKLIFDTSAINALAADPDIDAIVRGLGLSYHIGITESVLAEVIADPDEANSKRNCLASVLGREKSLSRSFVFL